MKLYPAKTQHNVIKFGIGGRIPAPIDFDPLNSYLRNNDSIDCVAKTNVQFAIVNFKLCIDNKTPNINVE